MHKSRVFTFELLTSLCMILPGPFVNLNILSNPAIIQEYNESILKRKNLLFTFMSTCLDLLQNTKPLIHNITKGHTGSINIAQSHIENANLSDSDCLYSYVYTKNRLVFEPIKVRGEGQ